jgi:hypothetical protein
MTSGSVTYGTPAPASTSGNAGMSSDAGSANSGATDQGTATTSSPVLDEATRREANKQRRTVERKGQMMQSITPRTEADRTHQMPDDSTPLLAPGRR